MYSLIHDLTSTTDWSNHRLSEGMGNYIEMVYVDGITYP